MLFESEDRELRLGHRESYSVGNDSTIRLELVKGNEQEC